MYTSNQQVFDIAARHLLTQGRRSSKPRSSTSMDKCLYRGPEGTKCAVGALIPDELYRDILEGQSCGELLMTLKDGLTPLWDDKDANPALRALQSIHDQHDPGAWRFKLRELANSFNLNTQVLDA